VYEQAPQIRETKGNIKARVCSVEPLPALALRHNPGAMFCTNFAGPIAS